jgi:hypothetical protein
MTSEQRLDRLERIAKLFIRAGLRERRNRAELDEKINIIISAQIANEERFAKNEERFAILSSEITRSHNGLAQSLAQSHNELSRSLNELAAAQTRTENRLDSLIDTINRDRNGNSS